MLLTHSVVMVAILVLLAPGGLSWLSEASSASRSFTEGVPMVASLLYGPLWMVMVLRLLLYGLALCRPSHQSTDGSLRLLSDGQ